MKIQKSKYNSENEWRKADPSAYHAAKSKKMLPEIRKAFGWTIKIKWNDDSVKKEALNHKTPTEWAKKSPGSYYYAQINKILPECCSHMKRKMSTKNFWTFEKCKKEAIKFNSPGEWKKNSRPSYTAAQKMGILNECCEHMEKKPVSRRRKHDFTFEECFNESKKHDSKTKWARSSPQTFYFAERKGWVKKCTVHMKTKRTLTLAECKKDALNYTSKTKWRDSGKLIDGISPYKTAYRNDWLEECCKHMINGNKKQNNNE